MTDRHTACSIVDDIRNMRGCGVPVAVIARHLHMSEADVRHVLEFGCLRQPELAWADLPEDDHDGCTD